VVTRGDGNAGCPDQARAGDGQVAQTGHDARAAGGPRIPPEGRERHPIPI